MKNSIGQQVDIYTYENYFTNKLEPFLSEQVDYTGNVIFQFETRYPQRVRLKVHHYEFDFIIYPYTDYELIVDAKNRTHEMTREGADSINYYIREMDRLYAELLSSSNIIGNNLSFEENEKLEVGFENIDNQFGNRGDEFFKKYFDYYHAKQVFELGKSIDNEEVMDTILKEIINKDAVDFRNPAYIDFIKHYSYNRFYSFFYDFDSDEMLDYKKELKEYKNDTVQQIVDLMICETGFKVDYEQMSLIMKWLSELEHSEISEVASIANDIRKTYRPFEVGQKAPEFNLIDQFGNNFSLDDISGNIVFLCFYATWNAACLDDIHLIEKLKRTMKDDVQFVALVMDGTFESMNKYIERNALNFDFVHANTDAFRKAYPIKQFPNYMAVDRNGTILKIDIDRPSENSVRELESMVKSVND